MTIPKQGRELTVSLGLSTHSVQQAKLFTECVCNGLSKLLCSPLPLASQGIEPAHDAARVCVSFRSSECTDRLPLPLEQAQGLWHRQARLMSKLKQPKFSRAAVRAWHGLGLASSENPLLCGALRGGQLDKEILIDGSARHPHRRGQDQAMIHFRTLTEERPYDRS